MVAPSKFSYTRLVAVLVVVTNRMLWCLGWCAGRCLEGGRPMGVPVIFHSVVSWLPRRCRFGLVGPSISVMVGVLVRVPVGSVLPYRCLSGVPVGVLVVLVGVLVQCLVSPSLSCPVVSRSVQ